METHATITTTLRKGTLEISYLMPVDVTEAAMAFF